MSNNRIVADPPDERNAFTVEVLEIRPVSGLGNLRAFAKVRVGPFTLHSCRIIQQPGQRAWAQLPMSQATGGRKGWFPVVTCDVPDLDDQVKRALVEAWEAMAGGVR
jgi:hypothetical protein